MISIRYNEITKNIAYEITNDLTNGKISIVGNYNGYENFCYFKCNNCKKIFKKKLKILVMETQIRRTPVSFCPFCAKKEHLMWNKDKRKTNYFLKFEKINSKLVISKYSNTNSTFRCLNCGNCFTKNNKCMLKRPYCPYCHISESTGEHMIRKILSYNNVDYKKEYNFYNDYSQSNQRIDFLFKYKNKIVAIEYQGNQHYNINNGLYDYRRCVLDKLKSKWCMNNDIFLYYIYDYQNIYFYLKKIIPSLKKPTEKYLKLEDGIPNKIIKYLENNHNLKETTRNFKKGEKYIKRIIKAYGYKNYFDLYQKNRLKRLNLNNDKIIFWLRHHHLCNIESDLGITKKYVKYYIFDNLKYKYHNINDIKREAIKSKEFFEYRKNHVKKETERYFMTDAQTITHILGNNNW